MIDKLDCSHTNEIICPYCGCEQSDSWEILRGDKHDGDTVDYSCDECEKDFVVEIHISVTYSSIGGGE